MILYYLFERKHTIFKFSPDSPLNFFNVIFVPVLCRSQQRRITSRITLVIIDTITSKAIEFKAF